jgi:hypothetical protein
MAPLLKNRSSQKENGLLRYVSREVAITSAAFRLSEDVVEPFACEVSSPIAILSIIHAAKEIGNSEMLAANSMVI